MDLTRNKAKRLLSVNHITKTTYHIIITFGDWVCGTSTSQLLIITDGRVFHPPTRGAFLKQRPIYAETHLLFSKNSHHSVTWS